MADFDRSALRKIFEGAEIEVPKDVLGQICDLHTSSMDGLPETIKELKGKLKTAEQERDAAKAKVPVDGEETISKAEYDKLKGDFDTYKKDVEAKETHSKKVEAYRAALEEDAKKHPDSHLTPNGIAKAIKYANISGFELTEDGSLKDADKHIASAREEWAEYVTTTTTTGAKTSNPPANTGSGTGKTRDEIIAIRDGATRRAEMAKNAHLFPEMAAKNN